MFAQLLQAKPEPYEDPLLLVCGRLLQQEAAIFSQSPSTPPGCDVGYGEREFQRQLSASRLLLCFFWPCVSKFNGTLYSHCPCRTSQPCSIEKYFDKIVGGHPNRRITRFSVKFSIMRFSIISIVDIPYNILWYSQFLIWCNFCVIITFIESCHSILS